MTKETVYLDIPQNDIAFLKELVKKMGWKLHFQKPAIISTTDKSVDELYGCIQLPKDFDYKKELEEELKKKYLWNGYFLELLQPIYQYIPLLNF